MPPRRELPTSAAPSSQRDLPVWAIHIKNARKRAGLSQTKLAQQIGKTQQSLTDYERGEAKPDLETVKAIAKATGVSAELLLSDELGPSDSDASLGALLERYQNDELFTLTFHMTAAMLADEGLDSDLRFTIDVTCKLYERLRSQGDQRPVRERVAGVVALERKDIRRALAELRKKRT